MGGPGRNTDVTDEEILDVFRNASDPVLTTMEVGDQIGLQQRGTYERLRELEDEGKLQMKKAGQASVWWLADS